MLTQVIVVFGCKGNHKEMLGVAINDKVAEQIISESKDENFTSFSKESQPVRED